jgi:YVTN family beta-propeller protein
VSGGGGSVTGPAQLTNAGGVATVGGWTLDTIAGLNTLTASVSGVTPATFTATGLAGAAMAIVKVAGDLQSAIVNTAVPTAPRVRIEDQFGNRVAGVSVSVAVDSGSGLVTNPSPVSDSAGVASVGSWQLGTRAGQNALTISANGLAGSPVSFTATGLVGVASQMIAFAGDGQAALAGTAVSIAPAVRVSDQFGNAVGGAAVTFTVGLGGGTVGLPATVASDTAGIATSSAWTLGTAGPNTLDATATGLPTVTFTAEALTSGATTIAHDSGTGQSGTVRTVLPIAYSVIVTDGVNPVAGVPVSWAAPAGSGSIAPALDTTDAAGISSAVRTLGPTAGTQTATASVGGLTGSPVTFTATALPGGPARLVKQSADLQTATVATSVAVPPAVMVADQFGNGVAGVIVAFAVTAGGGSVGAVEDTTDGLGLATAGSWTLGLVAEINTLTVTSGALPAVDFTATGVAGAPAQVAFFTEPARGLAGDTLEPVRVVVQDQYGNTVFPAKDRVILDLGARPNPAAKVTGTVDVAAVNGVATFSDVAVDSAGNGYTLLATADGLAGAESKPFDVGGVIDAILIDRLGPVAAALNPATRRLYVPGSESNTVAVLDVADTLQLVNQVAGVQAPFGVAVNPQTDKIYVTTASAVVVIDGKDNSIVRTIPVGEGPKGIAIDGAANRIYVAVDHDLLKSEPALVPIDAIEDVVVAGDVVPLPAPGAGVAFDPNNGFVYVAIPTFQEVAVIDPKPGGAALRHRIQNLGKGAYGVAFDARTNTLYVANPDENTVSVIDVSAPDPREFKEGARIAVGRAPQGVGVDVDRGLVYVANSGESTVSLIDAGKLSVFATLSLGSSGNLTPKAAVVDPVTGRVYVPTFEDDRVRVILP